MNITHYYWIFFMQVFNFLRISAGCSKSGGILFFGKCICNPSHTGENCDVLLFDKSYANATPPKNLNTKTDQKVTIIHPQYRRSVDDVSEGSGSQESDTRTTFTFDNLFSTSTTTYNQPITLLDKTTFPFSVESSGDQQLQTSSTNATTTTTNKNHTHSNDLLSIQTVPTLNTRNNLAHANQSNSSVIDPSLVSTAISVKEDNSSNVEIVTTHTQPTISSTKSTSDGTTSLLTTESIEFPGKNVTTETLLASTLDIYATNASLGSLSSVTTTVSFTREHVPASTMQSYIPTTVKMKPANIFNTTAVSSRSTNAGTKKTSISTQPPAKTTTTRFSGDNKTFTQLHQRIDFTEATSLLPPTHRIISTSLNQTIRQLTKQFTKTEETTEKMTTIPRLTAAMHCLYGQILLPNASRCAYYSTYYVRFKLNQSFLIDYYNLQSARSKKFIVNLKLKIRQAMSGSIYSGMRILSLKNGSLVVESEMYFYNFSNYNTSSVNLLLENVLTRRFPNFFSFIIALDKNECEYPNICNTNATCNNHDGFFSCQCKEGFTSTKASQHLPKKTCFHVCDEYVCFNGGVCDVALNNKPFCRCPAGYLGPTCQSNPWKMITISLSAMLGAVCIISLMACLCSIRRKNRKQREITLLPVATSFKRASMNEMKNSPNPFGYPFDVQSTTSFLTRKQPLHIEGKMRQRQRIGPFHIRKPYANVRVTNKSHNQHGLTRHDSIKQERTTATFKPFAEEDHKL